MHLLRLLTWVMELLDRSLNVRPSKASRKILEVQQLIVECADVYPSVKELSSKVKLSANYLSSLFHSSTGTTIRQYIANQRIEKAKNLLADPNRSIKDVAYQLGFQNPYHFSDAFRRVTGVRPSAYQLSVSGDAHARGHHQEALSQGRRPRPWQ
jgi:AraC-like DNA-binding protein